MAWVSPRTWVAGAILTAAQLNTDIRDNTGYLKTEVDSHHILAGTSTVYAKSGGVLYASVTATGNVGAGEDTLYTQSLAANTLSADKQSITGEGWVTFAANGNAKEVRIKFGATTILDTGSITPSGGGHRYAFSVVRTGAATQVAHAAGWGGGLPGAQVVTATTPAETLSGAVTFAVTGEGVDNNDIVIRHIKLWWQPAGN